MCLFGLVRNALSLLASRCSPHATRIIDAADVSPQDEDYTAEAPQQSGPLNVSEPASRQLLRELSLLEDAGDQLGDQKGRRAVLLALHSLLEGSGSEAARLLVAAVGRYAAAAGQATGGRALTLLLTQPALSRHSRSLLADPTADPTTPDYNLANSYSDDYPVIFNILLITSIFLIYILVAFSGEYRRIAVFPFRLRGVSFWGVLE